jgi:hypothetical protein
MKEQQLGLNLKIGEAGILVPGPNSHDSGNMMKEKPDLGGKYPESWACVDCGINTAPSMFGREQMKQVFALALKGVKQVTDEHSEVYTVKAAIWKAAGMKPDGGCLCVGCLERRIGRMLTPNDFKQNDPFRLKPSTERLQARRGRLLKEFRIVVEPTVNGKQKVFAVADGVRIARRTYLKGGVLLESGWVSLEPGWEVQGDPEQGKPVVSYKGVRMIH